MKHAMRILTAMLVIVMMLGTFALPASATMGELPDGSDKYVAFRHETEKRAAAAKRVAEKYGLTFLPLQKLLDDAAEKTTPSYWLSDGVHPTEAGHALIAEEWKKAFNSIMNS